MNMVETLPKNNQRLSFAAVIIYLLCCGIYCFFFFMTSQLYICCDETLIIINANNLAIALLPLQNCAYL